MEPNVSEKVKCPCGLDEMRKMSEKEPEVNKEETRLENVKEESSWMVTVNDIIYKDYKLSFTTRSLLFHSKTNAEKTSRDIKIQFVLDNSDKLQYLVGNLSKEELQKIMESNIEKVYEFYWKINQLDIEVPGGIYLKSGQTKGVEIHEIKYFD